MIRFDRVTKLYPGNSKPALNAVDVEIKAGEFVFLVGASGSGKSSFLRLVLKEEKPSTGEIHVLGQRLGSISSRKIPYFRRSLGVVFQDFRLLPNRTVFQNVAFTLQVIGKSRGFIQEAVPDVLQMVGLEGKAERLPHELSGGEQQRVAIARAVVNKPAILLADEPTGNLDPTTSRGIMQVLERINQSGTTVVMATHDVGIVDAMKRRVIELIGGDIVRDEVEGGYTTSIAVQEPERELELVGAGAGTGGGAGLGAGALVGAVVGAVVGAGVGAAVRSASSGVVPAAGTAEHSFGSAPITAPAAVVPASSPSTGQIPVFPAESVSPSTTPIRLPQLTPQVAAGPTFVDPAPVAAPAPAPASASASQTRIAESLSTSALGTPPAPVAPITPAEAPVAQASTASSAPAAPTAFDEPPAARSTPLPTITQSTPTQWVPNELHRARSFEPQPPAPREPSRPEEPVAQSPASHPGAVRHDAAPVDETTSPRQPIPGERPPERRHASDTPAHGISLAARLRSSAQHDFSVTGENPIIPTAPAPAAIVPPPAEAVDAPDDALRHLIRGAATGPVPIVGQDDALSLAVRLGLRAEGAPPDSPSAQQIGPTS